jgi:hypothetical protein
MLHGKHQEPRDFHATMYISVSMSGELERNWKEAVLSKLRKYSGLSLELMKKIIQSFFLGVTD